MALDTQNKIIAALAGGQKADVFKVSQTAEGAGTWLSLWKALSIPPAGVNPLSLAGEIPTSALLGAHLFTNYLNSHILQMMLSGSTAGKLIIYDRLWHNSTMS